MQFGHPLDALRHHVTGAIERGEAVAIVAQDRKTDDADGSIVLLDDGTLDTVIEYTCKHCDTSEETRFSDIDRDDDGRIAADEWERMLDDCAEDHFPNCGAQDA